MVPHFIPVVPRQVRTPPLWYPQRQVPGVMVPTKRVQISLGEMELFDKGLYQNIAKVVYFVLD